MRGFLVVVSLAAVLGGAPLLAQTPGQALPAQPPAATAPTPEPQPPVPFPAGARIAYVNLQAVAQFSAEGKTAAAKANQLSVQKQAEIEAKAKELQAQEQKLQTSAGVITDAARAQLEKDIERRRVEIERFQQDAQADLQELQQELQQEFEQRIFPILDKMAVEKGLHFLFSAADAGLIWAAQGLDLTEEAVTRLDASPPPPKP